MAEARIAEIQSGEKPALAPDDNAKYFAEVVVDLDAIIEPMIADPDVNNDDVSKRYTHDTIRPISYYGGDKKVDLGFVGSCMVHKGDMKIVAQMLRPRRATGHRRVQGAAGRGAADLQHRRRAEGRGRLGRCLQKYSGFEFDDAPQEKLRAPSTRT